VKAEFAQQLRCPACLRERTFALHAAARDEHEVREGTLVCSSCGSLFAVRRGVAELLYRPAQHVVAEAAGLERFAEVMRAQGWNRDVVRRLPDLDNGYWYVQARSMYQLLTTVPFVSGQTILDIGANTCWASNHFADRGLRPIAMDIATVELQGLHTADWFIEDGHVFFERVLGSMDAIPLASSSVDYIYCCQVLHHNDLAGLRRTFAEMFRVLRPGGRVLMVNETLKTLRDPGGVHDDAVEEYEGYEHAHWAARYRWEATRAGFFTEVTEPHYRGFFGDAELTLDPGTSKLVQLLRTAAFHVRRYSVARRAYLGWLDNVWGGVSMNMIATKPPRFVGRHQDMAVGERLLRTALAGARRLLARLGGRAPSRLPRSPEDAAARARELS
jgi:SAM-dependent methyltransferase